MIASTGKEMRSPYLDEGVIEYLNSVPLYLICDPREKPGVGDKKILRQVRRVVVGVVVIVVIVNFRTTK